MRLPGVQRPARAVLNAPDWMMILIKPCGCKIYTRFKSLDAVREFGICFSQWLFEHQALCSPHAQEKKDQDDKFWQDVWDKKLAKYNANYERKQRKGLDR